MLDSSGYAGMLGVGVAAAERQDAGGVRDAGVHGLARGVSRPKRLHGGGTGNRGQGIWHGDGRVGALGGRGCGERAH